MPFDMEADEATPAKLTSLDEQADGGESALPSMDGSLVSIALASDHKPLSHADLRAGAKRPIPPLANADTDSNSKPPNPGRNARGQFLAGNTASVSTGLYSPRMASLMAEVRVEFEQASVAEDPAATKSTRRRSLHGYRASLHAEIAALQSALEVHGVFDKYGRPRAWIGVKLALQARALQIDQLLGLETREKEVVGLHEQLAAAERERQRGRE
jgi:hypothetical protein